MAYTVSAHAFRSGPSSDDPHGNGEAVAVWTVCVWRQRLPPRSHLLASMWYVLACCGGGLCVFVWCAGEVHDLAGVSVHDDDHAEKSKICLFSNYFRKTPRIWGTLFSDFFQVKSCSHQSVYIFTLHRDRGRSPLLRSVILFVYKSENGL